MSTTAAILLFLAIVGFFLLNHYSARYVKRMRQQALDSAEELLRFFGPEDRMMAPQLMQKIRKVTGGKKRFYPPFIYEQLRHLAARGLLCEERVVKVISTSAGEITELKVTEYFLPK